MNGRAQLSESQAVGELAEFFEQCEAAAQSRGIRSVVRTVSGIGGALYGTCSLVFTVS
jgi:hypothetical protein